jgi:Cytochrome C oxidase, cbb3-type, subunit III
MFSSCRVASALVLACAIAPAVRAQTAAEGAAVYERRCASCHRAGSPAAGPSLPTVVTYPYRRFSDEVRTGRDRPAPLIDMPAFSRTGLADRDLCAIYLHVRAGRPDAAGDTAALCGLAPAPPGPASAASSGAGAGTPPPPPPPPDAALEASRRSFVPARNTPYRLQCRGGDSAAAIITPTGDEYPPWRYRLEFFDWRSSTELRRASCIWLGAAPPRHGSGPYRVFMEWGAAIAPAFQTFSYRSVDNAVHVDLDRRLLYSPIYRELVQAVSRPDAVFSFEVWYPASTRVSPATQLRVSAAAVRLGAR